MNELCVSPGAAFALCVVTFAAGMAAMSWFVLALGLLGDYVDRIDSEDGGRQ